MPSIPLGNEMAPAARRSSIVLAEEFLAAFNEGEAASPPHYDDIVSFPSPVSSPDLHTMEELCATGHQEPLPRDNGTPSSLPNSSLSSSPDPDHEDNLMEQDSPLGRVYLFDKAGQHPLYFEVPTKNGFFCLLNSREFLLESRVITHPLMVYDGMMGAFVELAPTAFWRQFSPKHRLLLKEEGLKDSDCPGLRAAIKRLGDPVEMMSMDKGCVKVWQSKNAKTPPSTQVPKKRKHRAREDPVHGPPKKISKFYEGSSNGTVYDPIVLDDDLEEDWC